MQWRQGPYRILPHCAFSLTRRLQGVSLPLLIGPLFGFLVFAIQKTARGAGGGTDCRPQAGIASHRTDSGSGGGTAQASGYSALLSIRHAGTTSQINRGQYCQD